MTKFRITIAALGLVATTALVAGSAVAGTAARSKTLRFSASYSGRAVVRVSGSAADIEAKGTGVGIPVAKSTLLGKGKGANTKPCPTFIGSGTITASDRSKLNFVIQPAATACPGAEGDEMKNAVSGKAVVKGGSGKFAKAKGTLKFAGIYDRGKGTFSVKFTGSLKV